MLNFGLWFCLNFVVFTCLALGYLGLTRAFVAVLFVASCLWCDGWTLLHVVCCFYDLCGLAACGWFLVCLAGLDFGLVWFMGFWLVGGFWFALVADLVGFWLVFFGFGVW